MLRGEQRAMHARTAPDRSEESNSSHGNDVGTPAAAAGRRAEQRSNTEGSTSGAKVKPSQKHISVPHKATWWGERRPFVKKSSGSQKRSIAVGYRHGKVRYSRTAPPPVDTSGHTKSSSDSLSHTGPVSGSTAADSTQLVGEQDTIDAVKPSQPLNPHAYPSPESTEESSICGTSSKAISKGQSHSLWSAGCSTHTVSTFAQSGTLPSGILQMAVEAAFQNTNPISSSQPIRPEPDTEGRIGSSGSVPTYVPPELGSMHASDATGAREPTQSMQQHQQQQQQKEGLGVQVTVPSTKLVGSAGGRLCSTPSQDVALLDLDAASKALMPDAQQLRPARGESCAPVRLPRPYAPSSLLQQQLLRSSESERDRTTSDLAAADPLSIREDSRATSEAGKTSSSPVTVVCASPVRGTSGVSSGEILSGGLASHSPVSNSYVFPAPPASSISPKGSVCSEAAAEYNVGTVAQILSTQDSNMFDDCLISTRSGGYGEDFTLNKAFSRHSGESTEKAVATANDATGIPRPDSAAARDAAQGIDSPSNHSRAFGSFNAVAPGALGGGDSQSSASGAVAPATDDFTITQSADITTTQSCTLSVSAAVSNLIASRAAICTSAASLAPTGGAFWSSSVGDNSSQRVGDNSSQRVGDNSSQRAAEESSSSEAHRTLPQQQQQQAQEHQNQPTTSLSASEKADTDTDTAPMQPPSKAPSRPEKPGVKCVTHWEASKAIAHTAAPVASKTQVHQQESKNSAQKEEERQQTAASVAVTTATVTGTVPAETASVHVVPETSTTTTQQQQQQQAKAAHASTDTSSITVTAAATGSSNRTNSRTADLSHSTGVVTTQSSAPLDIPMPLPVSPPAACERSAKSPTKAEERPLGRTRSTGKVTKFPTLSSKNPNASASSSEDSVREQNEFNEAANDAVLAAARNKDKAHAARYSKDESSSSAALQQPSEPTKKPQSSSRRSQSSSSSSRKVFSRVARMANPRSWAKPKRQSSKQASKGNTDDTADTSRALDDKNECSSPVLGSIPLLQDAPLPPPVASTRENVNTSSRECMTAAVTQSLQMAAGSCHAEHASTVANEDSTAEGSTAAVQGPDSDSHSIALPPADKVKKEDNFHSEHTKLRDLGPTNDHAHSVALSQTSEAAVGTPKSSFWGHRHIMFPRNVDSSDSITLQQQESPAANTLGVAVVKSSRVRPSEGLPKDSFKTVHNSTGVSNSGALSGALNQSSNSGSHTLSKPPKPKPASRIGSWTDSSSLRLSNNTPRADTAKTGPSKGRNFDSSGPESRSPLRETRSAFADYAESGMLADIDEQQEEEAVELSTASTVNALHAYGAPLQRDAAPQRGQSPFQKSPEESQRGDAADTAVPGLEMNRAISDLSRGPSWPIHAVHDHDDPHMHAPDAHAPRSPPPHFTSERSGSESLSTMHDSNALRPAAPSRTCMRPGADYDQSEADNRVPGGTSMEATMGSRRKHNKHTFEEEIGKLRAAIGPHEPNEVDSGISGSLVSCSEAVSNSSLPSAVSHSTGAHSTSQGSSRKDRGFSSLAQTFSNFGSRRKGGTHSSHRSTFRELLHRNRAAVNRKAWLAPPTTRSVMEGFSSVSDLGRSTVAGSRAPDPTPDPPDPHADHHSLQGNSESDPPVATPYTGTPPYRERCPHSFSQAGGSSPYRGMNQGHHPLQAPDQDHDNHSLKGSLHPSTSTPAHSIASNATSSSRWWRPREDSKSIASANHINRNSQRFRRHVDAVAATNAATHAMTRAATSTATTPSQELPRISSGSIMHDGCFHGSFHGSLMGAPENSGFHSPSMMSGDYKLASAASCTSQLESVDNASLRGLHSHRRRSQLQLPLQPHASSSLSARRTSSLSAQERDVVKDHSRRRSRTLPPEQLALQRTTASNTNANTDTAHTPRTPRSKPSWRDKIQAIRSRSQRGKSESAGADVAPGNAQMPVPVPHRDVHSEVHSVHYREVLHEVRAAPGPPAERDKFTEHRSPVQFELQVTTPPPVHPEPCMPAMGDDVTWDVHENHFAHVTNAWDSVSRTTPSVSPQRMRPIHAEPYNTHNTVAQTGSGTNGIANSSAAGARSNSNTRSNTRSNSRTRSSMHSTLSMPEDIPSKDVGGERATKCSLRRHQSPVATRYFEGSGTRRTNPMFNQNVHQPQQPCIDEYGAAEDEETPIDEFYACVHSSHSAHSTPYAPSSSKMHSSHALPSSQGAPQSATQHMSGNILNPFSPPLFETAAHAPAAAPTAVEPQAARHEPSASCSRTPSRTPHEDFSSRRVLSPPTAPSPQNPRTPPSPLPSPPPQPHRAPYQPPPRNHCTLPSISITTTPNTTNSNANSRLSLSSSPAAPNSRQDPRKSRYRTIQSLATAPSSTSAAERSSARAAIYQSAFGAADHEVDKFVMLSQSAMGIERPVHHVPSSDQASYHSVMGIERPVNLVPVSEQSQCCHRSAVGMERPVIHRSMDSFAAVADPTGFGRERDAAPVAGTAHPMMCTFDEDAFETAHSGFSGYFNRNSDSDVPASSMEASSIEDSPGDNHSNSHTRTPDSRHNAGAQAFHAGVGGVHVSSPSVVSAQGAQMISSETGQPLPRQQMQQVKQHHYHYQLQQKPQQHHPQQHFSQQQQPHYQLQQPQQQQLQQQHISAQQQVPQQQPHHGARLRERSRQTLPQFTHLSENRRNSSDKRKRKELAVHLSPQHNIDRASETYISNSPSRTDPRAVSFEQSLLHAQNAIFEARPSYVPGCWLDCAPSASRKVNSRKVNNLQGDQQAHRHQQYQYPPAYNQNVGD